MHDKRVLIIGEIFVDQHLDIKDKGQSISRLGGIFHAARACDVFGIDYALVYFAPKYLEKSITKFGKEVLNAKALFCLGYIDNSPNVILIGNSDETGNQQYDNILCKQAEYVKTGDLKSINETFKPSDIIIFPGRYGNNDILMELKGFKGKIHIDINYDWDNMINVADLNIQTVFLSTSSPVFNKLFSKNNYQDLITFFKEWNLNQVIIKENRGGSWAYSFLDNKCFESPAFFMGKIKHSVGVGDVYDISYLFGIESSESIIERMKFAALISVLYAKTLEHKLFKHSFSLFSSSIQEFLQMDGIRVSWFDRKNYPIYIAAPDFDYVDTKLIDSLEQSLLYHNFNPIRPIRVNGQVNESTTMIEEFSVYSKDIELLNNCKIMIAVLLYNDQGTLVEIGKYHEVGKSIILFDPYNKLNNMFLKHVCSYYCKETNEVIDKVFEIINRIKQNEN